ncbi:hypothetical protein B1748_18595 [Paenibacillus sp. MY03]|uniref:flagellar assembly protein FliW n=1 Tax=Paenibacillus sp. MY03 TaxID=302980 RepID=UPI000B3D0419|nr:flagellar assembly protein FliW [Paenibacillus sp. MY03]OUS75148.1 hypothetical protein B1748_18595 [Paenibacillus sp. MY03]
MLMQSSRLGEIEYDENEVISFKNGIPGFKEHKRFKVIAVEDSPFMYLHSIDDGALSFIIVSPFDFFQEYEFDLPDYVLDELSIAENSSLKIISIVTIRDNLANATINLAAPIIINVTSKRGIQYILPDGKYKVSQLLFTKQDME